MKLHGGSDHLFSHHRHHLMKALTLRCLQVVWTFRATEQMDQISLVNSCDVELQSAGKLVST